MQCRFSEYEIRFTDNDSSPARTTNRDFGLRQTQNELAKDGLILNDARGYAAHILDLDLMLVHLSRQNSKKTSIRAGITPAFPSQYAGMCKNARKCASRNAPALRDAQKHAKMRI